MTMDNKIAQAPILYFSISLERIYLSKSNTWTMWYVKKDSSPTASVKARKLVIDWISMSWTKPVDIYLSHDSWHATLLNWNPVITTFGMLLNQMFESPSEIKIIPLIAISIFILKHFKFLQNIKSFKSYAGNGRFNIANNPNKTSKNPQI